MNFFLILPLAKKLDIAVSHPILVYPMEIVDSWRYSIPGHGYAPGASHPVAQVAAHRRIQRHPCFVLFSLYKLLLIEID